MSLIPGRARVFDTLSDQVIRSDWIIGVKDAISRRKRSGIATGNRWGRAQKWRCARDGIELGQAVERLVRVAILGPVSSQRTKIVIERAILLSQEDDVIERGDVLSRAEGCGHLLVRVHCQNAGWTAAAAAAPCPSREGRVRAGSLRERYLGAAGKASAAGWGTADSGRVA